MTELMAALLGALVGGGLSAWASIAQTKKMLEHEVEQAATEREESRRQEEERRSSVAADQLLAALGHYLTPDRDEPGNLSWFVRLPATSDVHAERIRRVNALTRAGASHAHLLPSDARPRWDMLIRLVRFANSSVPERDVSLRGRDHADLLNYAEYVRQTLLAVSRGETLPPTYSDPDTHRQDERAWGFKPGPEADEPDLTDRPPYP